MAHLIGNAAQLTHEPHVAELRMGVFGVLVHEAVDPGTLLPGGHGHVIGHAGAIGPIVFPIMAGHLEPGPCASFGVRLRPAFNEKLVEHRVIVVADPPPVAHFELQT